jgi:uncharacterized membrane protein YedE/YeeE
MADPNPASGENTGGGDPVAGFFGDVLHIFTGVADTAHAIDTVGAALAGGFALITDKYMWRSLGWILIGAIAIFSGLVLWMHKAGFDPPAGIVPPIPIPV